MAEFFRGWKRKAGILTLVVACTLTGVWLRSLAGVDRVVFIASRRHVDCSSIYGCLSVDVADDDGPTAWEWSHWSNYSFDGRYIDTSKDPIILKYVKNERSRTVTIQFPAMVLFLTALSAWLLFSKSRSAHRTKQA